MDRPYGDPPDAKADAVDRLESIPFSGDPQLRKAGDEKSAGRSRPFGGASRRQIEAGLRRAATAE
jgi:hypothetical protein